MAKYAIYIDDERNPKTSKEFKVCRSMREAVDMILVYGFPEYISFDHDLGENQPTGFDFAKWLVNYDLDTGEMPDTFDYNIHSANPVGGANIAGLLDNYLQQKS